MKDTYNLLADGIVQTVACPGFPNATLPAWAEAQGYQRYLGSSIKGEATNRTAKRPTSYSPRWAHTAIGSTGAIQRSGCRRCKTPGHEQPAALQRAQGGHRRGHRQPADHRRGRCRATLPTIWGPWNWWSRVKRVPARWWRKPWATPPMGTAGPARPSPTRDAGWWPKCRAGPTGNTFPKMTFTLTWPRAVLSGGAGYRRHRAAAHPCRPRFQCIASSLLGEDLSSSDAGGIVAAQSSSASRPATSVGSRRNSSCIWRPRWPISPWCWAKSGGRAVSAAAQQATASSAMMSALWSKWAPWPGYPTRHTHTFRLRISSFDPARCGGGCNSVPTVNNASRVSAIHSC